MAASSTDIGVRIKAIPPNQSSAPPSGASDELVESLEAAQAAQEQAQAIQEAQQAAAAATDEWENIRQLTSPFPTSIINTLEKGIENLDNFIGGTLLPILEFLQFFISSFNSFSTLIEGIINTAQTEVNNWLTDIAGTGLYLNVMVPPAFLENLMLNRNFSELSQGGFPGFVSRLRTSVNNTGDRNRPKFSSDAKVGGMVMMVDTESLDEFYQSLRFLNNAFGLLDLVPINTEPMPPRNVRASSGLFQQDGQLKFGIKVEWDAPSVQGGLSFRVSRSGVSGGVRVEGGIDDIPSHLVTSKKRGIGLYDALRLRVSTGEWPKKEGTEYDDPDFNGGSPALVPANVITGGGSYVDFDVEEAAEGEIPNTYYYVVEHGTPFTGIWSPRSGEALAVAEVTCVNPDTVAAVDHPSGKVELIRGAEFGNLMEWSSIQSQLVIPFLPNLLELINGFLDGLKGAFKNNTKAFSDFLRGIQAKFQKALRTVEAMKRLLESAVNLFSGPPAVYILNLEAKAGGINEFLRRVENAQRPGRGFSGSNGITLGIVFVYGAATTDVFGRRLNTQAAEAQIAAMSEAFKILEDMITS